MKSQYYVNIFFGFARDRILSLTGSLIEIIGLIGFSKGVGE